MRPDPPPPTRPPPPLGPDYLTSDMPVGRHLGMYRETEIDFLDYEHALAPAIRAQTPLAGGRGVAPAAHPGVSLRRGTPPALSTPELRRELQPMVDLIVGGATLERLLAEMGRLGELAQAGPAAAAWLALVLNAPVGPPPCGAPGGDTGGFVLHLLLQRGCHPEAVVFFLQGGACPGLTALWEGVDCTPSTAVRVPVPLAERPLACTRWTGVTALHLAVGLSPPVVAALADLIADAPESAPGLWRVGHCPARQANAAALARFQSAMATAVPPAARASRRDNFLDLFRAGAEATVPLGCAVEASHQPDVCGWASQADLFQPQLFAATVGLMTGVVGPWELRPTFMQATGRLQHAMVEQAWAYAVTLGLEGGDMGRVLHDGRAAIDEL